MCTLSGLRWKRTGLLPSPKPHFSNGIKRFIFIWKPKPKPVAKEWRGPESKVFEVSTACRNLGCNVICSCWWWLVHCVLSSPAVSTSRHWSTLCFHLLRSWNLRTCSQCQNRYQMVCWPCYYCVWLARQLSWHKYQRMSVVCGPEEEHKLKAQSSIFFKKWDISVL